MTPKNFFHSFCFLFRCIENLMTPGNYYILLLLLLFFSLHFTDPRTSIHQSLRSKTKVLKVFDFLDSDLHQCMYVSSWQVLESFLKIRTVQYTRIFEKVNHPVRGGYLGGPTSIGILTEKEQEQENGWWSSDHPKDRVHESDVKADPSRASMAGLHGWMDGWWDL